MKILIVIINHAGLGHLNRGVVLAQSLCAHSPDVEPFLLVNSDLAEHFLSQRDIPYWNMPPTPWEGETPTTRKLTKEGIAIVRHAITDFAPDLLVYDTNFIEALLPESAAEGIKQVWIVRDRKVSILQQWFHNPVVSCLDLLLVPHEPIEFPSFCFPKPLQSRILFTGPLLRPLTEIDREKLFHQYGIQEKEFVLLFSAGGGNENRDTVRFLEMARIGCQELSRRYRDLRCIVITGMHHRTPVDFSNWGERVQIVPFEPQILHLMQRADLFVSEAGYNTCYERVLTRSPGIIIPVETKLDDQYRRAAYWEKQGGVIVLRDFSPDRLIENIVKLYRERETLMAMKQRLQALKITIGNDRAAQAILNLLQS